MTDEIIEPRFLFSTALDLIPYLTPSLSTIRLAFEIYSENSELRPAINHLRPQWKGMDDHLSSMPALRECEIMLRDCSHTGSEDTTSLSSVSRSEVSCGGSDFRKEKAAIQRYLPRLKKKGILFCESEVLL